MADLLRQLIPNVSAQAVDALSQPTFGPLDIGQSSSQTGSILLSANSTAVEVGQTFTVTVEIKTNAISVSEYRIYIDFDASAFSVVGDEDPAVTGTQIKLLDTIFTVSNPTINNTVSNIGRVTLIAQAPSGPLTVNKQVVQLTFQAQKQGVSSIKIVEGAQGSQLIRSQGVNLPFTSNELSILVGTQTGSTPTPIPPAQTPSSIPVVTPSSGEIPNTALASDILTLIPVLIGVILILLGGSLIKGDKSKKDPIDW